MMKCSWVPVQYKGAPWYTALAVTSVVGPDKVRRLGELRLEWWRGVRAERSLGRSGAGRRAWPNEAAEPEGEEAVRFLYTRYSEYGWASVRRLGKGEGRSGSGTPGAGSGEDMSWQIPRAGQHGGQEEGGQGWLRRMSRRMSDCGKRHDADFPLRHALQISEGACRLALGRESVIDSSSLRLQHLTSHHLHRRGTDSRLKPLLVDVPSLAALGAEEQLSAHFQVLQPTPSIRLLCGLPTRGDSSCARVRWVSSRDDCLTPP
ncbi:hypothetical protein M011DRAFT_158876 [Sporormia fimetaria CBS 119925]|uniref:Uncharacterized protein n=1 Tax=Sporormia fimetaria CBS 119925 TaxID=1340428 RepID=A0A6A6V463_9PLEO|nr:hypothetical protein M011DRAFT_158876 [Sporormia fimetaria CBS 119925]